MAVSAALRASFGFLLDRHHNVPVPHTNINLTPANALQSLFRRQRDLPLPITPVAILPSMLQFEHLQALLWAWTLVAILLLFAFWTNPSEASFRPFLTDLVFRERLRLLDDQDAVHSSHVQSDDAADTASKHILSARKSDPNAFSSLLSTASYSSGPFALTFRSKVALSLRTPPFHRKDLGLLSIVTISQSMPSHTLHDQQRTSQQNRPHAPPSGKVDRSIDCTSLFIGAFGKWWVLAFGIPDLPSARSQIPEQSTKAGREELEENLTDIADWGLLQMRALDLEPQSRRNSNFALNTIADQATAQPLPRHAPSIDVTAHSGTTASSTNNHLNVDTESEDCLSITALVSRSQSEIVDLQEQLATVKSASTRACEALELDLEEVRAKKKEEERLRSDIKARTKALDESKRQVESSRREAERRLKAANTSRALKQASIQQSKDQMEMLNKRRAIIINKKTTNAEKRLQRFEQLSALISQVKEKAEKLRGDIDGLRQQVQAAQDQLQFEKNNARYAQQADFSRDYARTEPQPFLWNPAIDATQLNGHEAMYAHLAAAQDPLVDSLARMEEQRALAGKRFSSSPFDSDAALSINKLPNAHTDAYADLGTSVLRNAFRRANAAAVADGREMMPTASQGLANPSLQNASNFEAIKQAFQPTVATEEDGRRSWSAFDVWQSDLRNGSDRQKMQWSSGGANASADSLPHFNASSAFLPLDRSSSAEQMPFYNLPGQADSEQTRNMSKVKRAFRWPFRPSQVQDDLV
ncbi:uncharacterized protein UBRO_05299 [Ustilago bromivora]|uniref:Uncharacterized protein n=1 Tax=Ustilago bromivora TaxID=307758 RepID=A0A1K0H9G6_9BASI|nr:uncharacterized protein UBRO_05299 [Ustilago bromivora]SYW82402.1 uncharacterized protein UBRO2_04524 [Ustilago bromivora]